MRACVLGYDRSVLTDEAPTRDREALLAEFLAGIDEDAVARRYREDDGLIVLPSLLPAALVDEMAAEARALAPTAYRKRVPFVRKAAAVHHHPIAARAPAMHALHQSPSLIAFFSRVTGVPLAHRDPGEAHASALYVYDEEGDWMDWHFDECGCPPGDSFSTVIGLIDDSSSRLEVETRREPASAPTHVASIHTKPGTFVFFCGARGYHRVTSLGAGEVRMTFAFTYIREGRSPGGIYDVRLRLGNALIYFGLGHLFRR